MKTKVLFLLLALSTTYLTAQNCNVNGLTIDAMLVDPNGANNFDTDGSGSAEDEDEFVQICNNGVNSQSLAGYSLYDDDGNSHDISGIGSLAPGECIVIITDYDDNVATPPGYFDLDLPGPWLNNKGDIFTLDDGSGSTCSVAYGNQSCPGPDCVDWGEQDGCVTAGGVVDCSIQPTDLGQAPLPVRYVAFDAIARPSAVQLNWSTAQEINNDYFEIQRSATGQDFKVLDRVAGHGNSSHTISYTAIDESPLAGTSYYRLVQYDFDGQKSISEIETIHRKPSSPLDLYPTAVQDLLYYNTSEETTLYVFDNLGRPMLTHAAHGAGHLDMSNLPAGLYFVTSSNQTTSKPMKISKL